MAQEVYVVLFIWEGYDLTGTVWHSDVTLRQVFDSFEKARAYCENPDHYVNNFPEGYLEDCKPSWNDDSIGTIYMLATGDEEDVYFSIETRNLL